MQVASLGVVIALESIYRLLEDEVVPLYYSRDRGGVSHDWIHMAKEAIRSIVPIFCTRRMLKEYIQKIYRVAAQPSDSV